MLVSPCKWAICLFLQLLVPREYRQIILYIMDGRLHIFAGSHAPSNNAILQEILLQFGTHVEGWNLYGTFLHLELFIQFDKWGARVVIHT
jgi:hypothetical protein